MEPYKHFTSHVKIMHSFYEWPKTRSEYNIFFKEVFRLPDFWPELAKKYVILFLSTHTIISHKLNLLCYFIQLYLFRHYRLTFGLVAGAGDTAIKLAMWQYIYGGTWSP